MNRLGAVVLGRNDGYGGNLESRASFCLNSLISTFDEVIYIDWGTVNNKTLPEEIRDNLIPNDKLKVFKITPEEVSYFTNNDPHAQVCNEVLSRNIGIRHSESDFIVSTAIDDVCPTRDYMDKLTDKDIFYIGSKKRIQLVDVERLGGYKDILQVQNRLSEFPIPPPSYSGAYVGDEWSIVDSCGDFQFASRELWYEVKGFEEFLLYRGFYDTNVQKKVILSGKKVELRNELPVYHIEHAGGFGGYGGINNREKAIANFQLPSKNKDTWGFSDYNFTILTMKDL